MKQGKRLLMLLLVLCLAFALCACRRADTDSTESETDETAAPDTQDAPETTDAPATADAPETTDAPETQAPSEARAVGLTLPMMETEDFVSFRDVADAQAAGIALKVPADWTEDSGLFFSPYGSGVRKVLEPVCLLPSMDAAQWEALSDFDVSGEYGETSYRSVTEGVDAAGRSYVLLLGESWPDGSAEISVWYPCTCFLRDPGGATAVLTYYFLDPEDAAAQSELLSLLSSIRFA